MSRVQIDFDKKLYWIDLEAVKSLSEWYIEQEDKLQKLIVEGNYALWLWDTRLKTK